MPQHEIENRAEGELGTSPTLADYVRRALEKCEQFCCCCHRSRSRLENARKAVSWDAAVICEERLEKQPWFVAHMDALVPRFGESRGERALRNFWPTADISF